ncbi:MAG: hypothetical protein ACRC7N_08115 [Clostridium sp.]
MVLVYCGAKQKDVIEEIEKYKQYDEQVFTFVNRDHIKLYFETTIEDQWEACDIVSGIISKSKYGKALFVNVVPFDGSKVTWFKK